MGAEAEAQPKMGKDQYEYVAAIIRKLKCSSADRYVIAAHFASELVGTNQRFDPKRFMEAATKK